MQKSFLGEFLKRRGLVTDKDLSRCVSIQQASHRLLGEIAVEQALLTGAQARELNEWQRKRDIRFGDAAIQAGMLTAEQVELLIEQQQREKVLLGQVLVSEGLISNEQLLQCLQEHERQRRDYYRELDHFLEGHALSGWVKSAISGLDKLFVRALRSASHFGRVIDEPAVLLQLAQLPFAADIIVGIKPPVILGVLCADDVGTDIASAFLGLPAEECGPELSADSVKELVNQLHGYVIQDLQLEDQLTDFFTPIVYGPQQSALAGYRQVVVVEMDSLLGECILYVATD